jgi:ankyrin repeat protein
MTRPHPRRLQRVCAALLLTTCAMTPCSAHETDQYTLPPDRSFANLADHFTTWAYDTINAAVKKVNDRIRRCIAEGSQPSRLQQLQSADEIAKAVFDETTPAYFLIEGLEVELHSSDLSNQYPGQLVAYKEQFTNIYQHVHFILDPRQFFRIWHASTFRMNNVLLGTDKIGHFTDMGINYYKAYSAALKAGQSKDQAIRAAVEVGTHGILFSERGAVGYLSAGAYSNADMVSNYLGFKFYQNLTEPVMLNGHMRDPMLVRDGPYWKLAPFVRRDSDFFTAFFSQHYNEAMNPSLFEPAMRKAVCKALDDRTERILNRYVDVNGTRRSQAYFAEHIAEMATYFGEDYGHNGTPDELVTIANICFQPFPESPRMSFRNAQGLTMLHDAAARGDTAAIAEQLDRGADVNSQVRSQEHYSPEWGDTPLHLAALDGKAEALHVLLERGGDVTARNVRGATPLHMAIEHPAVIELLIQKGADINAADSQGRTPLHWAAAAAQTQGAELLLEAGANAGSRDINGETPLFDAVRLGNVRAIEMLLAHGAEASPANMFKSTPLHVAAAMRKLDAVNALLTGGANVNAVDIHGWTPLHDAARSGSMEIVAVMLVAHANIEAVDAGGCSPLHVAARYGWSDAVRELLAAGGNPARRTAQGQTAYHEAAFGGRTEVVTALLARAAPPGAPSVEDRRGRTPYDVAKSYGHTEVAAMLRASTNGVSLGAK